MNEVPGAGGGVAAGSPALPVVGRSWREAVAVSGGDPFVRWHVSPAAVREVRAGHTAGRGWWAVRFAAMSYWGDGGLLVGGHRLAVALVAGPLLQATRSPEVTVPAGVPLPPAASGEVDGWAWLHTTRAPAPVPGEADVRWDPDPDAVEALLAVANPGAYVRPGHPSVRRWAGLAGPDGRLLACGAHTVHAPGVPHLAAVATHPDARGRGLGAALTARMTRDLLRQHPAVSLALWATNDPARRLYTRLGFTGGHDYRSSRTRP